MGLNYENLSRMIRNLNVIPLLLLSVLLLPAIATLVVSVVRKKIKKLRGKHKHSGTVVCNCIKCTKPKTMRIPEELIETAQMNNFNCEEHLVHTKDGFILSMYRITKKAGQEVHSNDSTSPQPDSAVIDCAHFRTPALSSEFLELICKSNVKPVVLLQHGLMQCGGTFIPYPEDPQHSLAFYLAEHGCDVWLGNNRGTIFSRKHKHLNIDHEEFWNWSQDEFANYDLPAMIDFTTKYTGVPKITYVGHSQGTTQAFACFSSNAEVSQKVNLFVAISPAAYVQHFPSWVLSKVAQMDSTKFIKLMGGRQFLPVMEDIRDFVPHSWFSFLSYSMFNYLFEWSDLLWPQGVHNKKFIFAMCPAGSSVKNIAHWFQLLKNKDKGFRAYDYGEAKNMEVYGTAEPMLYNVANIKVPMALLWGGKDSLVNVERLLGELHKDSIIYTQKIDDYEHMDFLWAHNASELVFPKLSQLIFQHTHLPGITGSTYQHVHTPSQNL